MSKENIFSDNNLGTFIENDFGDRFLYSVNGSSFNKISAHSVYRDLWGDSLFKENTLYLLVGTDSGLLPTYIQRIGIPEGSRYLFVELEEIIPLVSNCISPENTDSKKILICSASDWQQLAKQISLSEYAYLDAFKLVTSVAVSDAHLVAYSDFAAELEKEYQRIRWHFQVEFGNLTFITRHIENLAENRLSAAALIDSGKNKTAVLLAGGPSLDTLLPWIQKNRKRLILVAVSRISKRLIEIGLEPDIVVTVDPHFCSYEVSKHMLRFESAILVNAYHATPLLVAQWQGQSLYLDHRYPWENDKNKIVIGRGPTVSNSAINLCIAMGCSQVVFAGLDLCFSQEGFTHAKGSIERGNGAFVAYATQTVETNEGKTAETDHGFFLSISAIEEQAKIGHSRGIRFINPAPTAANMEYVEFIETQNIVLPDEEFCAGDLLAQYASREISLTRRKVYDQTVAELKKTQTRISKLIRYSYEALKYNDGLFGRNGITKNYKYKIKMDKVEKKIVRELNDIANIAKIYGMTDFVKTLRPDDSRQWSDEEIEQAGSLYYHAFIHGANKLSQVIETQLNRLALRQEEESEHPNIARLVTGWRNDNTPGRAKLWKRRFEAQYNLLNDQDKRLLEQQCQEFEQSIDTEDTQHRHTVQRYADLKPVIGKLQTLMHRKDIDAMKRLLLGLNTRQEAEAAHLAKLASAHIAELEEDMQLAVNLYRELIELDVASYVRIIEVALIRLSVLCMNCGELELAAQCLKNLSDISYSYTPHYAEALRLSDQVQQAIDAYTGYLSKVPEDLASMMKLGILYKSIGVREGAAWLFDYVYRKDPDNLAAKRMLDELELSA